MRWPLPCATPTRALVPCPTCSRAAPTPRASPGWASAASGSPRCGYRPNWTSRRCSMASTNGYRSTDYSSACECSTGSCRAAERPRFPGGEDMTDRHAELDAALDRVMAAAREHLAAVKAADGRTDDDEVWRAYVELNNASFEYDELLLDAFGEVTPWDVEAIDPDEADRAFGVGVDEEPTDPYPRVVSVRQRRYCRWRASVRRSWSSCRPATGQWARWTSRSWSPSTASWWSPRSRAGWTRRRTTTPTPPARSR